MGNNYANMAQIVRSNEGDEFLAYFPQYEQLYNTVKTHYDALCFVLQSIYNNIVQYQLDTNTLSEREIQERFVKELSSYPQRNKYVQILLCLCNKQGESLRLYFANCELNELVELLKFFKNQKPKEKEDDEKTESELLLQGMVKPKKKKEVEKIEVNTATFGTIKRHSVKHSAY